MSWAMFGLGLLLGAILGAGSVVFILAQLDDANAPGDDLSKHDRDNRP